MKMNKRDCVEYILSALLANQERTSEKVFSDCKSVCASNGYVGECFYQLWCKAVNKYAALTGVRPNYG